MNSNPPTSDRVMQLVNGYWATGIIGAAASHSLFTHLEAGVGTADQLAGQAGISQRGAQTLLDGLVSLGLVELRDGRYRNTAEASAFLVEGQPTCLSSLAQLKLAHMGTLTALPDVVRAGGPVTDAPVEVADNPHWEKLVHAIAAQSVPVASIAADVLRVAEAGDTSILDIGGGSGIYSAIWLGLNPAARSTQLDWGPINAIARRLMADRGVADRFSCIDGDFHTTDLGTAAYDVVVYSHIAHQEGPAENVAIFARIREALQPGGTLVISDYLVDDDRSGPPFPLIFASEMLLKSKQGGTWRRADYHAWLAKAGFEDVSFRSTPTPATLVFARGERRHHGPAPLPDHRSRLTPRQVRQPDPGPNPFNRVEPDQPRRTTMAAESLVLNSPYQQSVADYWDREKDPVNLKLGEVDGTYHHHYGIGEVDQSVLDGPENTRGQRVIEEMHRLESAQASFLLNHLGSPGPGDRVLDAGCGRGGTSFMANGRFGCGVDGVSISEEQVSFANEQAHQRGVAEDVRFHLKNMLDTGFERGGFTAIWNNESTMYVELSLLFAEHSRLLACGGRYVCITGCYNDAYGLPSRAVSQINAHYICSIHSRSTYFREMAANRLVPMTVVDLTSATIPYWELRAKSSVATGIEDVFLEAYRSGSFQYLLIAADRV